MKKIAMLLCSGADGGGANTIGEECAKIKNEKIKFDVFCNSLNIYAMGANSVTERKDGFIMFDTYEELYEKIKNYEYICVLTPCHEKDKNKEKYLEMIKKLDNKKIYFALDRTPRTIFKTGLSEEHLKLFDTVLTFGNEETNVYKKMLELCNDIKQVDFNFFDYERYSKHINKLSDKDNNISYFGRFANFKGFNKIVEEASEGNINLNEYNYLIQGGCYKFAKNGKLSSTLGIISELCKDLKSKEIKDNLFIHNDYNEYNKIRQSKLNVFPSYIKEEMLPRMAKCKFSLFPLKYKNKTRNAGMFETAMEYTMLESIAVGTPLIIHEDYAKEFKVFDKTLWEYKDECGLVIFDKLESINKLCKEYEKNYDLNVNKMINFFKNKYSNDIRIDKFIKEVL